jgi:Ca2+-binding EF-hand superfamily protein
MPRVSKNFDAIDADKDGSVTMAEIQAYMKAQHKSAQQ